MANGIDQNLYFVEVDFGGRIGRSFVETDRDANSRKQIIHNIRVGEYRGPVVTVIECNPVERTSRDVTDDILAEAGLPDDYRTPFTGQDKLDWEHDRRRAIEMAE